MNINLLNFNLSELGSLFIDLGEQKFRAKQFFNWFYKKGITDLKQISNIPQSFKENLSQNFETKIPQIYQVAESKVDNSYKFLLKTEDKKLIEAILMLNDKRATLCVSCMIGCPLKCKFCATGSELKFIRKLETFEIIGQIIAIQNYAQKSNIAPKITNIVFMGMGEPLLNLENIKKSLDILLSKEGFGLSRNKITISTAGITDGLVELINEYNVKLAISLHFPTDEQRNEFMPINKKFPLKKLVEEAKKINLGKRNYITIEYLMIDKINDTLEHAQKLINLVSSLKVKINLIPYNPTKNLTASPSDENRMNAFAKYVLSKSIMVTVRRSKGKDLKGGCGQFVLHKAS